MEARSSNSQNCKLIVTVNGSVVLNFNKMLCNF